MKFHWIYISKVLNLDMRYWNSKREVDPESGQGRIQKILEHTALQALHVIHRPRANSVGMMTVVQ